MKKLCRPLSVLLVAAVFSVPAQAQLLFHADLTGDQEVPPNASSALGFANVVFDPFANTLSYFVNFNDMTAPASASHIHVGDPGVAGPVIFPLAGLPAATDGTFSGVLTSANLIPRPAQGINTFADAISALESGRTYVNIHNSVFPGGEIRGQLQAVPEPGTFVMLACAAIPLAGLLRRRNR